MSAMRYAVIEPGEQGYGAYVPDLPGCERVRHTLIRDRILFHLDRNRARLGRR